MSEMSFEKAINPVANSRTAESDKERNHSRLAGDQLGFFPPVSGGWEDEARRCLKWTIGFSRKMSGSMSRTLILNDDLIEF